MVDNSSDDPTRNVTIDLTVVDTNGDPLVDQQVILQDRGGTPDDRTGTTGPHGRLRFIESVGPAPCNWLTARVPEYDTEVRLGCYNGNSTLERRISVET